MPSKIEYRKGDATNAQVVGPKIIIHCVNNLGKWGSGFVLALSGRWPNTRTEYLKWHSGLLTDAPKFELGAVLFVKVEKEIWVANIVGQNGIRSKYNQTPVNYDALTVGLVTVSDYAKNIGASVVGPRICCGLAGGVWSKIEPIINECICSFNIPVTIYDL